MGYPQGHPLFVLAQTVYPGIDEHRLACKSGNEMDYKRAEHSADKCFHCGEPIEKGTFFIGLFRYRFSMAHTSGKWHPQCFRAAVEAAPKRNSFCWLSGKWTKCKVMRILYKSIFTATREALLDWFEQYTRCDTAVDRLIVKERLRSTMLQPTIQYWLTKARKKAKRIETLLPELVDVMPVTALIEEESITFSVRTIQNNVAHNFSVLHQSDVARCRLNAQSACTPLRERLSNEPYMT